MIDPEVFVKSVREVIAERPDYVYVAPRVPHPNFQDDPNFQDVGTPESCVYVVEKNGTLEPSCVIGCALIKSGMKPERFGGNIELNNMTVRELVSVMPELFHLPSRVVRWAEHIQAIQDQRTKSWSQALNAADKIYPIGETVNA